MTARRLLESVKVVGIAPKTGGLLSRQAHVHGPNCNHDHDHAHDDKEPEHDHQHGPGCGHEAAHEPGRVHGPSCGHEAAGHGHDHSHGHAHSHDHDVPERAPTRLAAETGGPAVQLDLNKLLPGETDEIGRFEQFKRALEILPGILKVHLRKDQGFLQACVHYDEGQTGPDALIEVVRSEGARSAKRYITRTWFVRGMDSAQCAYVIEHALHRMKGVLSANVAYAAERVVIEFDKEVTAASET